MFENKQTAGITHWPKRNFKEKQQGKHTFTHWVKPIDKLIDDKAYLFKSSLRPLSLFTSSLDQHHLPPASSAPLYPLPENIFFYMFDISGIEIG